ncbi:MAG: PIN domain-containing protein [Candidatus Geothermincolia bacterium]
MVVIVVRLLSMVICSYGGYRVSLLLNDNYILRTPQQVLAIIIGIILGLLIGFVVGGPVGRSIANILGDLESVFYRASGADIFFSTMGAFIGLMVALLPSFALFHFGYPGYIVSVVLFLLFGFAGARVGVIKHSELAAMFKLGPSFGTVGANTAGQILDTSVIIDGRVVDIAKAGFMDGTMVVPRFVLTELQGIADSADTLKRSRGRRGLDVLNALQRLDNVRIEITDQDFPEIMGVDAKLTALSKVTGMPLTTNDFNLNKVAEIQGVKILNINELASAMKPVVLPGEEMHVKIIREGKEAGQGVAYLDDGTMVVVEHGKKKVGSDATVVATSVLQTPAGKMIFTELKEERQEA